MQRVILFDGQCASCSRVAKAVIEADVPGLTAQSLQSPAIQQRLEKEGLSSPAGPALLRDDGERVHLLTGLAMRMEVVRVLGPRRGRKVLQLAAMETGARMDRRAMSPSLSRRGALGAAVAGAGGLVLSGGPAQAASAKRPHAMGARASEVRRVLRAQSVRKALKAHGPVAQSEAMEIQDKDVRVIALDHRGSQTTTFVDADDHTKPTAITIEFLGGQRGVRCFMPDGTPLGDFAVEDGRVVAHPPEVTPQGIPEFRNCFFVCYAGDIGADCLAGCIQCAQDPGPICASLCGICAGPSGVRCAIQCADQLG